MNFLGENSAKENFQTEPFLGKNDFEIVRSLSRWTSGARPNVDFLYFLRFIPSLGYVAAQEVIGVAGATFHLILPQAALLSTLRKMLTSDADIAESKPFSSHPQPWPMYLNEKDKRGHTYQYWKKRLGTLTRLQCLQLKGLLVNAHKDHTLEPFDGESCMHYIRRHGQRYGEEATGYEDLESMPSRKKALAEDREAAKWKKSKKSPKT